MRLHSEYTTADYPVQIGIECSEEKYEQYDPDADEYLHSHPQ
jgi:hypothetical protein